MIINQETECMMDILTNGLEFSSDRLEKVILNKLNILIIDKRGSISDTLCILERNIKLDKTKELYEIIQNMLKNIENFSVIFDNLQNEDYIRFNEDYAIKFVYYWTRIIKIFKFNLGCINTFYEFENRKISASISGIDILKINLKY
jgi:hypothetical protein